MNTGSIIGIVIGVVFGVLFFVVMFRWSLSSKNDKHKFKYVLADEERKEREEREKEWDPIHKSIGRDREIMDSFDRASGSGHSDFLYDDDF